MADSAIASEPTTVPAETARVVTAFGTRAFFGLAGSGNFHLTHELRDAGLAYYAGTHESACVAMADGYARTTGTTAVATVHQGPGFTNAVTALCEGVRSHSPMVVLAADVPTAAVDHNQHLDQAAVAQSVDAGVEIVSSADAVVDHVTRAFRRAASEHRPIVVLLPTDIQGSAVQRRQLNPSMTRLPIPGGPAQRSLDEAVEILSRAKRPVILAGRGAVNTQARNAIVALADLVEAPLLTSTQAHSLFGGHPRNLGVAGGFGTEVARGALRDADVVLVFGASLNPWTTGHDDRLSAHARVIQVDIDAAAFSRTHPVCVPVVGDCALTACALEALMPTTSRVGGARDESDGDRSSTDSTGPRPTAANPARVDPRELAKAIDRMLPLERTISIDSGHFMIFPAKQMRAPDPAGFLLAQGFMSMGLALAEALGAAVARPDRLSVAMLGDGSAKMSLCELDTAVRHHLRALVVIFNDAAYGAEVHDFAASGRALDIVKFRDIDFAGVARALGADALSVRTIGDLAPLDDWLGDPARPLVVDAKVDPTVRGEWIA